MNSPLKIRLIPLLAAWFSLLWSGGPAMAQTATPKEYQVKAAFLYNFCQFVEWPETAFPEKDSPFIIGVIGDDPFGPHLKEIVQGEKVGEHPLIVQHFERVEDIRSGHILFISQSEQKLLDQVLSNLKGRSILTVGEMEGFASRGGMIRFVNEKSKIRFRINVDAAKAANLTISSKLLRAAEIVDLERD